MKILDIKAREILDSRGNPTVEVELRTDEGVYFGIAPSGASTGSYEAYELRDGGKRYHGKGVLKAMENIEKIIRPALLNKEVNYKEMDKIMINLDGTPNKSKLGANAIVAVSMALLKAQSKNKVYEFLGGNLLPMPQLNIINGGLHAGNNLSIQEFHIIPVGAKTFKQAIQFSSEVYHQLKKNLKEKYGRNAINVGDEGGFAPNLNETRDALNEIVKSIEDMGYKKEVKLSIDSAATDFYKDGKYDIDGKRLDQGEMVDYYKELVKEYEIISIEDPFEENDFEGFAILNKEIGNKIQIVGDDLLVTNPNRLKKAIEMNSVNALLLKINQIGTISESLEVANMCKENNLNIVVSHRSGETEDYLIADFAIGINAGQIKTGAPARGERTVKYNRLLRIEEFYGKFKNPFEVE